MAAYLVVEVTDITDEGPVGQYVQQAPAIVARYGGRYIARGPATVLEGNHQPLTIVLIEFPSMEQLQAFYSSDDYAPLIALRQQGSSFNFLAVEGLG
jgi:uncharacterized protein (DUF1330 family)